MRTKKKILMVAPNFKEATAWMASAYNTASALAKAGHKVVVLTSRTKGSQPLEYINGVFVHRIPCFFIPDPFNYVITPFQSFKIIKLLRSYEPDVVIVNKYMFYTSLSVFLFKLLGKKVILQTDTFPGINWVPPSCLLYWGSRFYSKTIGKMVLKAADLVVLLSQDLIVPAKSLGIKKYKVISTCIDLEAFK